MQFPIFHHFGMEMSLLHDNGPEVSHLRRQMKISLLTMVTANQLEDTARSHLWRSAVRVQWRTMIEATVCKIAFKNAITVHQKYVLKSSLVLWLCWGEKQGWRRWSKRREQRWLDKDVVDKYRKKLSAEEEEFLLCYWSKLLFIYHPHNKCLFTSNSGSQWEQICVCEVKEECVFDSSAD